MRAAPARGLTLLELMVTLMIVSMALALLGQLMHQMSQVERRLEDEARAGQVHWAPRIALRSLMEAALPEMVSRPTAFAGDERQLTFASAEALAFPGAAQGQLSLRFEGGELPGGEQRLLLMPAGAAAAEGGGPTRKPAVLMRWRGEPGRIQYLDDEGRWQSRWPYDPAVLRRPPRVLRLLLPQSEGGTLWLTVGVTTGPRASLAYWVNQ